MGWFSRKKKKPALVSLINDLPDSGMTVYSLKALDFVMPGEWNNITYFDEMVQNISGETDEQFLKQVKNRAIELYDDKSEGYRTAMWLYNMVDKTDKALGTAAFADKLSKRFKLLSFLDRLTPKADTSQAIDLGLKLTVELLAFTKINGIPGDSFGDFVRALADYGGESKMRMAALICYDGLMPLGPNFIAKGIDVLDNLRPSELNANETFNTLSETIPGDNEESKLNFIQKGFASTTNWMSDFVTDHNISIDKIIDNLSTYVDIADDSLDYLAAFIDVSSQYYRHTGAQTLAARLIERAVNEV